MQRWTATRPESALLMIRTRCDNLQRQRKKDGGRKGAGRAFVVDAGWRLGVKHYSSSSARDRGKGREGRGRGGHRKHEDGEEEEQHKAVNGKGGGGRADNAKGNSVKCKSCGETGHKSARCPD